MKTTMFRNKILTTALLGAAGAIALCAQQAFALGMMGGAVGVHVGAMGSGRMGSIGMGSVGIHGGTSGMAGAVTMNGITVLPNGTLIVPAVTPRVPRIAPGGLNSLDPQQTTGAPCRTAADCTGY
jgi:hypothetical protein